MRRFVVYTRVSTGGQDDNTSQPVQLAACRFFGEEQGWQLDQTIHDTKSGSSFHTRKGVQDVLTLVESGRVSDVVFFRIDRVGRDGEVIKKFVGDIYKYGGAVSIVSKNQTYPSAAKCIRDNFFEVAVAEYELMTIRERMVEGRMHLFQAGSVHGRLPFGYETKKITRSQDGYSKKFKEAVIIEKHAESIREALIRFVEFRSLIKTVRWLNRHPEYIGQEGEGGRFTTKVVLQIIRNAMLYAGEPFEQVFSGVKRQFRLPPIIDLELAVRVNEAELLRERVTEESKPGPFRGLVYCENCGERAYIRRSEAYGKAKQFLMCASYDRKLKKRAAGRSDVADTKCLSTIGVGVLRSKLDDYLKQFDDEEYGTKHEWVVVDQVMSFYELEDDIKAFKVKREEFKMKRSDLIKTLTQHGHYEEIASEVNYQLKTIVNESDTLAEQLSTLENRRKVRRLVLTRLGVNVERLKINVPTIREEDGSFVVGKGMKLATREEAESCVRDVVREQVFWQGVNLDPLKDTRRELEAYAATARGKTPPPMTEHLSRRVERLKDALNAEDWGEVNRLMVELGLRFVVPFAERSTSKRRAAVRVVVDFAPLEDALTGTGGAGGTGGGSGDGGGSVGGLLRSSCAVAPIGMNGRRLRGWRKPERVK
ncbi:recombinase family protein [Deinococcus sp. YIM 134068]|uniref:recombinase family protein n=1 Tax=Deinococcus lichenicola TaxID=3118910 RepID=UPI002F946D4C